MSTQEIGMWRGKPITTDMSKEELLEIIAYTSAEMLDARGELNKYSDRIYAAKLEDLDIGRTGQPTSSPEVTP